MCFQQDSCKGSSWLMFVDPEVDQFWAAGFRVLIDWVLVRSLGLGILKVSDGYKGHGARDIPYGSVGCRYCSACTCA